MIVIGSTDMKLKQIGSKRILYVMASELEYGSHLKQRFSPLITGMGPVEAAIQLSSALTGLNADGSLPDCVICLGSAGSATLNHMEIYQVSSVSYRDMDARPLGFDKGITPLLDIPAIVDLAHQVDELPAASLSTGASIVAGEAYQDIDADMADMETFAVLRACMGFDIPMIGLRGISDGKTKLETLTGWTDYLHIIDEKLAEVVDKVEQAITNGSIL